MKIAEIFTSVQGEGMWLGMPSLFIRAAGCNLNCSWCDTPRARTTDGAEEMTVDTIIEQAEASPLTHVVITGGEPTLYAEELARLCDKLHNTFKIITLETNATRFVDCNANLVSLSPKLPGSQENSSENVWNEEVIRQYMATGAMLQVKIVVADPSDAMDALIKLAPLNIPKPQVFLMPQARTREEHLAAAEWLVPFCNKTGYRFGTRLQTLLWNNEPGK
jgi:7-carboxy-7-deazaguanine synthase